MTIAVSTGDPAGVGPVVALRAAVQAAAHPGAEPVVLFGDVEGLLAVADACGVARGRLERLAHAAAAPAAGRVGLVHVAEWPAEVLDTHRPTAAAGAAQLASLDAALAAVVGGWARALVTAPTSKEAIAASGASFVGQTERCASAAGLSTDAVSMCFLGPRLRTSLVTTHVPIRDVADRITEAAVVRASVHLAEACLTLAPAAEASVLVAGLNPHAGEGGLFGDEEARVVAPAVERARSVGPFADGRARLAGPMGAETAFRRAAAGEVSGVVAMTHDQATIASKLLDFGSAANVTWGLPFVRTSPDHGVAYEAAASGRIDDAGMVAAFRWARRLLPQR